LSQRRLRNPHLTIIQVVFYDVTTIYFEANKADDYRIAGFSKDGKHQHPQILLGLLVGKDGMIKYFLG